MTEAEIEKIASPSEEDTYHTPETLDQISTQAKWLSWAFVAIGVFILVANLSIEFKAMAQSGILANLPSLLNALFVPLVCGFFYILLQAVSEGIFLFMDIEDNTRGAARK
jgi:hypothetical protein